LSRESAILYNNSLKVFWDYFGISSEFMTSFDIQKKVYKNENVPTLHSDSKIGIIQNFRDAVTSWSHSIKEYEKDPNKFTSEPKPPTENKTIAPIIFKQSAIKYKRDFLLLSLAKGNSPIRIRWDIQQGLPCYAVISYKSHKGRWQVSFILKHSVGQVIGLDKTKNLGGDLGQKRTITTFDGKETVTYSGKSIKSEIRLREKNKGKTQSKLSGLTKYSKRYKKIKRAGKKATKKSDNRIKDTCHKISRTVVNYAVEKNIGTIVIGECAGIHTDTNLGNETNQAVQMNPEQKVAKYIKYKFESIGGTYVTVPEHYTSQTCPICGELNNPNNRKYKCKCGFKFDRDGVGAINIWNKKQKVSFGSHLNVVGGLTLPIGWKYHTNRDCLIRKN
jgi:putative transposase